MRGLAALAVQLDDSRPAHLSEAGSRAGRSRETAHPVRTGSHGPTDAAAGGPKSAYGSTRPRRIA
jgi:hypothetical protein